MTISRREFFEGLGALGLTAGAIGGFNYSAQDPGWFRIMTPASAQVQPGATVSMVELMVAGPLGDVAQGRPDAPVTVIEYASMTCGHCAAFHVQTYPAFKARYIDTGKVRYILREYPLDQAAAAVAMLARCTPERYFDIVDIYFQKHRDWVSQRAPLEPMFEIAKQAGFTRERFEACLRDQRVLDGIVWNFNRARDQFRVNSTPTFFINGRMYPGNLSIDELARIIDPLVRT